MVTGELSRRCPCQEEKPGTIQPCGNLAVGFPPSELGEDKLCSLSCHQMPVGFYYSIHGKPVHKMRCQENGDLEGKGRGMEWRGLVVGIGTGHCDHW